MDENTNEEHLPYVDIRPSAGIVRSPLDEIKAIQTLLADVYKDAGDGRTLFRELVQNAGDASAQQLGLTVLEHGWPDAQNSLLRGPALLVANDGAVPDKDREALHKAIGGSKEDDADKIGTFASAGSSTVLRPWSHDRPGTSFALLRGRGMSCSVSQSSRAVVILCPTPADRVIPPWRPND